MAYCLKEIITSLGKEEQKTDLPVDFENVSVSIWKMCVLLFYMERPISCFKGHSVPRIRISSE